MKKRYIISAELAALALSVVTAVAVAAPTGKLKCFSGSPATCVVNSGSNSATLDTSQGGFAGVYLSNGKNVNGSTLSSVDFSFTYTCQPSNTDTITCVGGGAPRWSIPINTDGNAKTVEGYAFIDAFNCGSTGTVSTTSATCKVFFGPDTYANWDAFALANPTYTIGNALPFVISDVQTSPVIIFDPTITKA